MENRVTIKIPRELYTTLKDIVSDTGFSSVNEFIVFVMRSLASTSRVDDEDKLADDEVRIIKDRLTRLGYLKEGK